MPVSGLIAFALSVGVAAVVVMVAYLPVTGTPTEFPQHPDTIFHLGTIQLMIERADVSSLRAGGFTTPSGEGFYPGAFHAIAATAAEATGSAVPAAASVLAFVVAALVWPAACVLLARVVLGPSPAVTIGAAVTSVAFSAFPYWLMGYGVLWPNLLGYALLPAALACLATAVSPSELIDGRRAALALVAVLPGLALAHPNAVFGLAVLGYLAVAQVVARRALSRGRGGRLAGTAFLAATVVGAACFAVLTGRSAAMRQSNPPGPEVDLGDAFQHLAAQAPRKLPDLWVVGIVVLVGAVLLLLRRRTWWVFGSLVLAATLYVLVVAVDSPGTRLLTWPWYNNAPRLAALVVIPSVVAATAVAALVADLLTRGRRSRWGSWVAALVAPALLLAATGAYVDEHREVLRPFFHDSARRSFVTDAELSALRALSREIPQDAVVAADPWKGADYLYVVSGRRLLFPTEKTLNSPDRELLADRLDQVGESAEVCAAARRQDVRYAITGGMPPGQGREESKAFHGVDGVDRSAAFREVAQAGPYTLYELVGCAES